MIGIEFAEPVTPEVARWKLTQKVHQVTRPHRCLVCNRRLKDGEDAFNTDPDRPSARLVCIPCVKLVLKIL